VELMASSIDSLTPADQGRVYGKMMERTPREVREFLSAPSERYLLNSAVLPAAAEARAVTLNVPGFVASTLWVRRVGGANRVPKVFEGYSADSSVSMTFYQDSVVVGELTSPRGRLQFRSGVFGDVVFVQDTAAYVPEAPPLVPRDTAPPPPRARPRPGRKSGAQREREEAAPPPPPAECAPRDLTLVVGVPPSVAASNDRALLEGEIQRAVGQVASSTVLFLKSDVSRISDTVMSDLEVPTSAASKELHAAVTARGAVGGLLVLSGLDKTTCGRSFVLQPGRRVVPFGYVLRHCLNQLSVAHEVTHFLGANHVFPEKPAFSIESYGYHDTVADFRTIEGVCPPGVNCLDRIARLSDRTKQFRAVPRGASTANSAHAFRASLCTLTGAT
jgi:hypothetical protein